MSRSLEFVELIITCGIIKFVIACHAPWDQLCCSFIALCSLSVQFINANLLHKVQSDDWQYVFCKDYCLVLIVKCLFAKASTANAGAELLKLRPRLREHQLIFIKATYSNTGHLGHTLKVAILTSYKKVSVGYFELKLHIHTLGISETCFTSCKKEHNRSV